MPSRDPIVLAHRHHQADRRAEAEAICRRLLDDDPRHAGALHLLGLMAQSQQRLPVALRLMRMAVDAAPAVPDLHNGLGTVLADLRQWDAAIVAFDRAVALDAVFVAARRNCGTALARAGRLEDAASAYRQAVRLAPADAENHLDLIAVLHELGDLDEAIAVRRAWLAERPDDPAAHSQLLVTLHYPDPQADVAYAPEAIFREHLDWAERHARPLYPRAAATFPTDHAPGHRLRIGYVSPDFRDHPVARFIASPLARHDRERYEVFCYSDVARPDATTARLRASADGWRAVRSLSDAQLVEAIRRDRIDVLVDLAGHMDNRTRLLVFARRAAPVQVAYLGYPDTTGLATMDWRITDELHDPPGTTERYHTEHLLRLDGCCWCYDPGGEAPAVADLPALRNGHVTFAAFNRLLKVTDSMIRLWARVLDAVPDSVLAVRAEGGVDAARRRFERQGIDPARLRVAERRPGADRAQYMALFNAVDVLLDPYPYNGNTTTCDALWMGVPVVSLAGPSHHARSGASILNAVGLGRLVARAPEGYVRIAAGLASDRAALAILRLSLRQTMASTVLMDASGHSRRLESAYQRVWEAWRAKNNPQEGSLKDGGPAE